MMVEFGMMMEMIKELQKCILYCGSGVAKLDRQMFRVQERALFFIGHYQLTHGSITFHFIAH